jgi:hypothetical protein
MAEAVLTPKEAASAPTPEPPYSIYNKKEKWVLTAMVAIAGLYGFVLTHGFDDMVTIG